ncbi:MAG: hypothetical protein HPY64_01155 [Anaerolineae bacterium]|nr:hypothetical protein [Anaerolineae bacterium]
MFTLTTPSYTLPAWAVNQLSLIVWNRDAGPQTPLLRATPQGPTGRCDLNVPANSGDSARLVATVGWGASLEPVLVHLPWKWGGRLDWDGTTTLIGYVEQLHLQEWAGLPLLVLELVGHVAPVTYRRLPPLPVPALGDRHGLHTDRPLEDSPEQIYYLLAEAESPLATLAQDALVSSLRVVAVTSLGAQKAGWHNLVNLPLVLDGLTLIGP